ncbi:MAG: hypothetical protein PHR83_18410 [Paludibacter sp.]|nr:hypothetical protein [Paludibacter sp.]
MKKLILISTVILLIFVSCENSRIKENQKQETPEALQEESKYDIISKRGYGDILESLYGELASKTPELKELENKLDTLSAVKGDSTKSFDRYDRKNQSYYSYADNHVKQINDSVLRKQMQSLILSSLKKYNSKIYRHTELLKSIDRKSMTLGDLHEILIITTTLPLIEKYQNENLPGTKSINGYLKQLDKAVEIENSLLEKNDKKGKKE